MQTVEKVSSKNFLKYILASSIVLVGGVYLFWKKSKSKLVLILHKSIDPTLLKKEIDAEYSICEGQENIEQNKQNLDSQLKSYFNTQLQTNYDSFRQKVDLFVLTKDTTSTQTEIDKFINFQPKNLKNVVYMSLSQKSGKGRGNNKWTSFNGGIYLTIGFSLDSQFKPLQLSMASALVMHHLLQKIWPTSRLKIKWPNDIYFDDNKVSGVLTEVSQNINHPDFFNYKMGIGLNIENNGEFKGIRNFFEAAGKNIKREVIAYNFVSQFFDFIAHSDPVRMQDEVHKYIETCLYQNEKKYTILDKISKNSVELTIIGIMKENFKLIGIDAEGKKFKVECEADQMRNMGEAELHKID